MAECCDSEDENRVEIQHNQDIDIVGREDGLSGIEDGLGWNKSGINYEIHHIRLEVILEHIDHMGISHCCVQESLVGIDISDIELGVDLQRGIVLVRIQLDDPEIVLIRFCRVNEEGGVASLIKCCFEESLVEYLVCELPCASGFA